MEAVPAADQGAAGDAGQQSPLLHCLSQLNDDVLTAHLLPKLVEQRSAGAVVLTCSQLRGLLQPSIQHLDLTKQLQDADNPCHSPELAKQLVAAFPNCTSLDFAWARSSMAAINRSISPLLSGLPNLSSVSINVKDSEDGDIDYVLALMHMHATGVRSLSLQIDKSWVPHDETWGTLGKITNLTELHLTFNDKLRYPCYQCNLQLLASLPKLSSLCITAPGAVWGDEDDEDDEDFRQFDTATLQSATQQFPGRLTTLTELQLQIKILYDFSSVSKCVDLRDLQLRSAVDEELRLQAQEWDALLQLTRLTCLRVDAISAYVGDADEDAHSDAHYNVLRQLKGLRVVGACTWAESFLPVLQGLTNVTAVYGGWRVPSEADLSKLVCPHVRELGGALRDIPFCAFPNITSIAVFRVSATSLSSLRYCCTGLQRLSIGLDLPRVPMVVGVGTDCTSAMKSLAHLQHLTHLELSPINEAQLLAFTGEAATVSTLNLRYLHVQGPLTVFALMQLQSVRGLQELSLRCEGGLKVVRDCFTEAAVRAWLVGLAVVPKVSIVLCSEKQHRVVEAVRQQVVQWDLHLPALLKVTVNPKFNWPVPG